MRAPRVPRTLVTSQHQPREVEVGLEDKESLWAPFGHPPHTHQVGAGVGWKLLRQARTPSFVGRGAGKRAEEEAASFSLGRCLHPSHELAGSWLRRLLPSQVCEKEKLAGCGPAPVSVRCSGSAGFGHQKTQLGQVTPDTCLEPDA